MATASIRVNIGAMATLSDAQLARETIAIETIARRLRSRPISSGRIVRARGRSSIFYAVCRSVQLSLSGSSREYYPESVNAAHYGAP